MKAFVWKFAEGVTDNWHDGGAVLVIATDLDAARVMWAAQAEEPNANMGRFGSPLNRDALDADPDRTWPLGLSAHPEPEVLVFPDAGCC